MFAGHSCQETEDSAGALDAGLAAAGGGGHRQGSGTPQGIDHDQGGPEGATHFEEQRLMPGGGEVDELTLGQFVRLASLAGLARLIRPGGLLGCQEEEVAAVKLPLPGALVEEGGGALGVDDEDTVPDVLGLRQTDLPVPWMQGLRGPGIAADDAPGKIQGHEGFAHAGRRAEQGDHAARDPVGPAATEAALRSQRTSEKLPFISAKEG
jgi:hypothetical protein